MKNRRLALVAFLLCACMIVGVGYAALTDTLKVGGTVSMGSEAIKFDGDIYWKSAEVAPNDEKVTVELTNENDTLTITADALDTINEAFTVTAIMKNKSDKAVNVAIVKNALADNEYFTVDFDGDLAGDAHTIVADGEATLTITITMKKIPTDAFTGNFDITYTVTKAE